MTPITNLPSSAFSKGTTEVETDHQSRDLFIDSQSVTILSYPLVNQTVHSVTVT